jgi:UDP-glucuronate decarboxylase
MNPDFVDAARILVTGGAGFLGSHLCDRLVQEGNNVISLDNYFTFGNPKENTILELVEQIIRLTHSKSRIAFRPAPMDDPKRRQPDITFARKQFNWRPKVDLEEGLEKTIQYFKEFLSVA